MLVCWRLNSIPDYLKLCSSYYYAGNQIEVILNQRLFLCQKSEGFALAGKVHHRANVNGVRKDLARLAVEVPDDAHCSYK